MNRVERHLGWVTVDGQRYPLAQAEDWQDAISKGLCPFCGSGPFTVVALHVSQKHGVDRLELRDWLGLPCKSSICDPTYSALMSDINRSKAEGRDWSHNRSPRRAMRTTTAARSAAQGRLVRHPCVVCGEPVPARSHRATCSEPCRRTRVTANAENMLAKRPPQRRGPTIRFVCPECGVEAEKSAKVVRGNQQRQGAAGPFCGRSCAARHTYRLSLGRRP